MIWEADYRKEFIINKCMQVVQDHKACECEDSHNHIITLLAQLKKTTEKK